MDSKSEYAWRELGYKDGKYELPCIPPSAGTVSEKAAWINGWSLGRSGGELPPFQEEVPPAPPPEPLELTVKILAEQMLQLTKAVRLLSDAVLLLGGALEEDRIDVSLIGSETRMLARDIPADPDSVTWPAAQLVAEVEQFAKEYLARGTEGEKKTMAEHFESPKCEECNELMHRYQDPNTGKEGWSCDLCAWSMDDET